MKRRLILILLVLPALVWAQPQQSENFQITKSVIDVGGAASASENFQLVSAFGQPSPLGAQTSESFNLWAGFLTPMVAISPLSPIQALVVQAAQPNVLLAWERVSGANSYKIYRDTTVVFTPGPGNYLDAVADTAYYDASAIGLPAVRLYYIVTASTDAPPRGSARTIPDFRADSRKRLR